MKMFFPRTLTLFCYVALLPFYAAAASDLATGTIISDPFTLKTNGREAGKLLNGIKSEAGEAVWVANDGLIFAADGSVTVNTAVGGVALVPIPLATKPITVSADIDAHKSGWVGLAFVASPNPDSFWDSVSIFITYLAAGDYVVYSDGINNTIAKGANSKASGSKAHVELSYDPGANTVTVRIDGVTVVDKSPLGAFKPRITAAGFRFQEPLEVKGPMVSNFAVTAGK